MTQRLTETKYLNLAILSALILFLLRLLETSLIVLNFGTTPSLFQSELFGLSLDVLVFNVVLLLFYPIFFLISKRSVIAAQRLFIGLLSLFVLLHFLILNYFLYQLVPLDTFLYQYSFKEILFTINTSEISYLESLLILTFLFLVVYFSTRLVLKIRLQEVKRIHLFILLSCSVLILLVLKLSGFEPNKFTMNKSSHFYSRTCTYFLNKKMASNEFSDKPYSGFQQLYSDKQFLDEEFPLLHKFKNLNDLDPFFNKFEQAPNIVLLIVEGLNDDFIHQYKGIELMPFLSNLKEKSLYWNRCFTLGERSFAAVPSLLGSLPYGEKGFTLLEKLPRHLTLVSILNSNNYFTSFFYGQGSWFHLKDRFFNSNNVDLLVDNSTFSEKYDKIIVGDDHFFWGYNDKDLFNHSLEVIDHLPKKPRLDVYFTGTSHSPFAITDPEKYDERFLQLRNSLASEPDKKHFDTYRKYLESVLFVDDALEEFFRKYESREDFKNTIFIITGDHPMTELPISNSLKRYHVPLIIYSKQLKAPQTFKHTVSHLDVSGSVLSLLAGYDIKIPEKSSALGTNLVVHNSEQTKHIAFMNDNREIIDYYSDNHFLSAGKLYTVNADLSITEMNDRAKLADMQSELQVFKSTNNYVCANDKITPDSLYYKYLGYKLIDEYLTGTEPNQFEDEFYPVVKAIDVRNKTLFFDLTFDPLIVPEKDLSLVYQLSTKNDSILYWGASNISMQMSDFPLKLKIPKQNCSDSIVSFKSFFWNRSVQKTKFKDLKFSIHQ